MDEIRGMQRLKQLIVLWVGLASAAVGFLTVLHQPLSPPREKEHEGYAMEMFDWWYSQRALPNAYIPAGAYQKAVASSKALFAKKRSFSTDATTPPWSSLGPNNVGGRILALAINPSSPSTVWAGSASGGLWKTTTAGIGTSAWSFVNTGFNALSVGAIAIDPLNPQNMLIGTGEISFYHSGIVGTPGARSSYGLGVLRTSDGGVSWAATNLAWTFPQATAVMKIVFNPVNPLTAFAATSEGVWKSTDGGLNWSISSPVLMAMDLVMNPADTSMLFAAHGNLNSTANPGIYRTTDAGATWTQLAGGLPTINFGRTGLAVSPAAPATVYAGVSSGDPANGGSIGLYKSTDYGATWTQKALDNYVGSQGWYDNVVAVNPASAESVFCSGLDIYRSTNGGTSLNQQSDWTSGYLGSIPPGGSEGTSVYAHADHHAIAFDPVNRKTIYFGTDGGVFKSTDGGNNFFGVNGGLVTTQFYNGFASAYNDSTVALGGLQDNGVIKYTGSTVWRKVDGGDGGWNAIDPTNSAVMYDEYVYLAISKTTNGGSSWSTLSGGLPTGSANANFIAPFAMSHSTPSVLYAGARNVYKSTNGGGSWTATNGGSNLNGTKISALAVSFTHRDTVMAATGSSASSSPVFQVFATTNGGTTWSNVSASLPSRFPTDIEFDPTNSATAYVTFSGYGTPHVFRTTNLGQSWNDISTGVDIPHQSVAVDPDDPSSIFVGTDLGVYHSSDYGAHWEAYSTGMNPAMVLDLSICYPKKTIRAATFGSGVYERPLVHTPRITVLTPNGGENLITGEIVSITWTSKFVSTVNVDYSTDNGATWSSIATNLPASPGTCSWTVPDLSSSLALVRVVEATSASASDVSDATFQILRADVTVGWNLLSLDRRPPDPRPTVLYPQATSNAFTYQAGYVSADTLVPGVGFWLKFPAPFDIVMTGDSVRAETLAVQAGWNMIGGTSQAVALSSVTTEPPGIIISQFFGYKGGYTVADSLLPRKGYWVKVSAPGTMLVQPGPAVVPATELALGTSSPLPTIEFRDASGGTQSLFLSDDPRRVARCMRPPLPPPAAFDIRFSDGGLVAQTGRNGAGSQTFTVRLQGVRFPLRLRSHDNTALLSLRAEDGTLTPIGSTDLVVEKPAERLTLVLSPRGGDASLPAAYAVEPNYPNPFNPTTTIRYAVPRDAAVTLELVNIAGQIVARFDEGVQSAGWHTAAVDASQFASGIYFARLRAQSPEDGERVIGTVKMALVR